MLEINLLIEKLNELKARSDALRGIFDLGTKETRLLEIQRELENPAVWQDPEKHNR